MRNIALLTAPSTMSARSVISLIERNADRISVVAWSDPLREPFGAPGRRSRKILLRSRLRLAPFLLLAYVLPRIVASIRQSVGGDGGLTQRCRELGIPLIEVPDVDRTAFVAELKSHGAETVVMTNFDQIVGPGFIEAFGGEVYNFHPSLLPRHRGPCPSIHALAEDEPIFGATLFRVSPTIDDGTIVASMPIDLPPDIGAIEAAYRVHVASVDMITAWLQGPTSPEFDPPHLPYCPWPDAAFLRTFARRGRRLVGPKCLRLAWTAPV